MKAVIEATEVLIKDFISHDKVCSLDCKYLGYNTEFLSAELDRIANETL